MRWRIPGRLRRPDLHELFRHYPFTLLDEGDIWSVSGLCGRIWTPRATTRGSPGPEEFREWDEGGTVRVLFAHWAEPAEDGRATLVSEARVDPVDATARLRLRALWTVIGPFEPLVGAEPLAVAARRAEAGVAAGGNVNCAG